MPALKNRRIWITGASLGIGRALAIELARQGARVALSSRNAETLAEVAEACGDGTCVEPLDVTDREANRRAVTSVVEKLGGLDTIVLNAGTCEYVDLDSLDSALFERQVQVNYLALIYGIEAALPHLGRGAHIVGMSSSVAYGALPRAEAYGATKAAAKYTLEAMRLTLRRQGIAVSVICPGFVRTPLTDQNDFPMPFRVEADDAARIIARGMARQKHEIHFPRRFTWTFKALSRLPSVLYTSLIGRLVQS